MTTIEEAVTATTFSTRVVDRVVRGLGRFGRRGFLVQTAVVGSALVVDPKGFVLTPQTAASTVCGPSASCSAGYTVMCCTINKGVNSCPPGTFAAGWWKAADSSWCCGGYRYIVDCNATCSRCTSGCSDDNICSSGCWSCGCRCGSTATCDQRRVCCNAFRYGQCNTQVRCSGGVACRVVSCVAPYRWASCSTTSLSDNSTAEHNAPCLQGCSPVLTKYDAMNANGSVLGASVGPDRYVGDNRGRYVNYEHGTISWSSATGARAVYGEAYPKWASLARERGVLGYATTDRVTYGSVWVQYFERGVIGDTGSSSPAYVVGTPYTLWRRAGGVTGSLGVPTSDLVHYGSAWVQYFQKGAVADTASSEPALVVGPAYARWVQLGGVTGVLGLPVSGQLTYRGPWVQLFQRGALSDTTTTDPAYITGPAYTRWVQLGRETGLLGFVTSDAVAGPGGGGGQHLERGELWWASAGQPWVVRSRVLSAWTAAGGAAGRWGYPLEDTVVAADGSEHQRFEGGVLTA